LKALNACLQREYAHEVEHYKIHKKIANLICDMGFILSESPASSGLTRYHRLVKQTDRHLIVVTYKLRRRLIRDPTYAKDLYGEGFNSKQVQGESFGDFLKKHGLVPPDMMGFDERQVQEDHKEALKNPAQHLLDDPDDQTFFEIALINKANSALVTDCKVRMGEVQFHKWFVVRDRADEFIKQGIWFDKVTRKQGN